MYYNKQNMNNAKQMRSNMTKEEVKLWNVIRAKGFYGYKFKRQVLIGNYIVDFLCPEKMLIVEIDGGQHSENVDYDDERTEYLKNNGYRVLRFWNNDVWDNFEGVCCKLKEVLEK